MDNEVWKEYYEFYFIQSSNFGRVRTLDRVVSNGKGMKFVKGRILPQYDNRSYLCVSFSVNGKTVHRSVHRIVAQTFLPNPNKWPEVNHLDGDRTNNNVDNLEWCTHEYNIEYREKYGTPAKESAPKSPVYAVNLDTLEVSRFHSQHEASRVLKVSVGNLNSVLKGERKQTGGYWFVNAGNNAVEATKSKFDDEVACEVEKLMKENNNQK